MPYQPTWNNPYLPINSPSSAIGQSSIPAMQQQLASGWGQYQQPVNGITKVNDRDSAMQYQLPPNSMSPALFDKNGQVFYIVSTDGTGTKTVETFDFSPHVEVEAVTNPDQFVSRSEFDRLVARIDEITGATNGIHGPVQAEPTTGRTE